MGVTSSDVYNKITTLMIWKTDFFQFRSYVCWGQGGRRRGAGHTGQNSSNEGNVNLSKRENKGLTWAVAWKQSGRADRHLGGGVRENPAILMDIGNRTGVDK